MISVIRRSFSRMLSTSCSGGRWAASFFPLGFLMSRFAETSRPSPLYLRISAAETFQARSFSSRFPHQVMHAANSSNRRGWVLV
jgi:hypothetical protein